MQALHAHSKWTQDIHHFGASLNILNNRIYIYNSNRITKISKDLLTLITFSLP